MYIYIYERERERERERELCICILDRVFDIGKIIKHWRKGGLLSR
jgi:hypothetical protein